MRICQRMYEAAEADFRKAVEEEREEALQNRGQENEDGNDHGARACCIVGAFPP